VNLSTRATRSALEQNAEALRRLGGLAEEVRSGLARQAAERAPGSAEELRPVAKALLDIHDLLTLFRGRVGDMGERVSEALARLEAFLEAPLPAPPGEAPPVQAAPPRGFWSRLFGAPAPEGGSAAAERDRWLTWHEKLAEARESQADAALQAATLVRRNIESLLTGYSMSLSRLESVLARLGIEPIPCAGRPFDPEEMEVLELVPDSGQPPGNVLEEVRRGFRWNDKVLRYAQVKVAQ
ncbi:MAG TPA: nucleotide exchange factor GrpE, partial [Gemmataceae bacterium]